MTTRKKDKGFIALYRDILDHWIWTEKPFDRPRAWIDLLLTVNYADKEFMFNGKITTVKRGSIITSISKLSERWEWSTTKVSNFLNLLEKEGMISQKRTSKNTVLTIDNYAFWQDIELEKNIKKISEKEQKNNRAKTEKFQKNNRKIQLNQDKPSRTKINQVNKENKLCTESEADSMQNTNLCKNKFIDLSLNDGSLFEVSDSDVQEWSKLYPAVDIKQELRKMKGWLDANPTRRKTRRGVKRFVVNWLSRTQDQGGTPGYANKDKSEVYKQEQASRYADDEDSLSRLIIDPSKLVGGSKCKQ